MWFLTAIKHCNCGFHDFDKRTYGWFTSEEEMREALVEHAGDMTGYEEVVAEFVKPGFYGKAKKEYWFRWTSMQWKEIDKPANYKRLTNWFIG